jgi:hypothetical protein
MEQFLKMIPESEDIMVLVLIKLRRKYLSPDGNASYELIESLLFFSEVTYVGRLRNRSKFDYQIELQITDPHKREEWVNNYLKKYIVSYDIKYPDALAA